MESTISHTKSERTGVVEEIFTIGDWIITTHRSHILNSKCVSPFICGKTREKFSNLSNQSNTGDNIVLNNGSPPPSSSAAGKCVGGTPRKSLEQLRNLKSLIMPQQMLCNFCKFDLILEMAHLPDMTYANNFLRLCHRPSKLVFEFNVLDSLMPVIEKSIGLPTGMKVSPSEAWLKARMGCEYTKNVMNAEFDWTFSSDYRGSFRLPVVSNENNNNNNSSTDDTSSLSNKTIMMTTKESGGSTNWTDLHETEEPLKSLIKSGSDDRINMEKLKQRNKIHFYDEIDLFEDELADHGVAKCSAKIRVMDDSFFILLRFFLRIDNVFVRFYDTRIWHEFGQPDLIRECSNHEASIHDLKLKEDESAFLLTNPSELYSHVPQKSFWVDKIALPDNVLIVPSSASATDHPSTNSGSSL